MCLSFVFFCRSFWVIVYLNKLSLILLFQGVGKDQLAVSDYVKGMTIVGADGNETKYEFPSKNPDLDNALKVKSIKSLQIIF